MARSSLAVAYTLAILILALPKLSLAAITGSAIAGHSHPVRVTLARQMTLLQATQYAEQHRSLLQSQVNVLPRVFPFRTRMSPSEYASAKLAARSGKFAPRVMPGMSSVLRVSTQSVQPLVVATAVPYPEIDGLANSRSICPPAGCRPPDQGLASTPSGEIAEAVNGSVGMFNAGLGTEELGWPLDMNSFLGGVPYSLVSSCNGGSYPFFADPRMFWDANTGRMWLSIGQYDGADLLKDGCPDESFTWYAVSRGPTFNSGWYIYYVETDNGVGDLSDYPTLGYDTRQDTVASCFNNFVMATMAFDGAACLSLEKAGMESGIGPATSEYINGIICIGGLCGAGTPLDTIQPVQTKAGAGTASTDPGVLFMISTINFYRSNPDNRLITIQCKGTGACIAGSTLAISTIKNYVLAPDADVNTGSSGSCVACVETSDPRISATPQYSPANGGAITFALETGAFNGSQTVPAIEWGELHVVPGPKVTIFQNNYLAGQGDMAVSFGAIAERNNGTLKLVYDVMSLTHDQDIRTATHSYLDPRGSFSSAVTCRRGVGPDILNGRWGDYAAATFDGANIWVAGEYMTGGGDWGTAICI